MKKIKLISIIVLLILVFSACSAANEIDLVPTPTNTPQVLPTHTATLTPTPLPTKTPAPTATPLPEVRILTEGVGIQSPGPWLLVSIYDGTYLVSVNREEIGFIPGLYGGIYGAPAGGNYAVLDWEDWRFDLEIRSVQSNEVLFYTKLLDYQGPAIEFEDINAEMDFEGSRHYSVGNLNWSHTGDWLAFTGSINQHSIDLFAFDISKAKLNQITAALPFEVDTYWTPDDAKIFYANVSSLNPDKSGSGYNDWAFYISNPDEIVNIPVFSGIEYGWEEFLGWVSSDQALMYSEVWYCGDFNLRLVNVQTGQIQPVFSDYFHSIGYDPATGTALIFVLPPENTTDECKPKLEAGLYWVSIPSGQIEQVAYEPSDFVDTIEWDEAASQFLIRIGDKWAYVSQSGEVLSYDNKPLMSPNGEWIAFKDSESEYLYITDRSGNLRINLEKTERTKNRIWSLDGETFYFLFRDEVNNQPNYGLYFAQAPNFVPTLLIDDLEIEYFSAAINWVLP